MSGAGLDRVETDRLVCVRMTLEHRGELASLLRDPRVALTLLPTGEPARETMREVREAMVGTGISWKLSGGSQFSSAVTKVSK